MTPDVFILRLIVAGALALVMCGAVTAWVSPNALKRVVGVVVALCGGMVALAALGAPSSFIIAAAAIVFVTAALGVALVVRVQEAYGAIEGPELDQADRQDDAAEQAP